MRSVPVIRRLVAALIAVPLACALVGCGSPSDTPTVLPLFKSMIDEALSYPNVSDFEREVFSDYVITDEEYAQAEDLYIQCMADRGWVVTLGEQGTSTVEEAPGVTHHGDASSNDPAICSVGTTTNIEPIYWEMRRNPTGMTYAQQVRACYEKHGVSDGAGMTDDEFEKMINDQSYHASTPAGKVCYFDAAGTGGLTEEGAEQLDAARNEPQASFNCTPPSEPNAPYICHAD